MRTIIITKNYDYKYNLVQIKKYLFFNISEKYIRESGELSLVGEWRGAANMDMGYRI